MTGNVLDWNTASWTAENLQESEVELETIKAESYRRSAYQLFISEKRKSFPDSLKFCRDIGGVMAVAESQSEAGVPVSEMISAMESRNCGENFWTGWTDEEEEGEFVSAVSGEPMVWDSWSEPSMTVRTDWYSTMILLSLRSTQQRQWRPTLCQV